MYIHIRKSGNNKYVYIVEAYRNKKTNKIQHRTIERVGRYDILLKQDPNFLEKLKRQTIVRTRQKKIETSKFYIKDLLNNEQYEGRIDLDTVYNGFPQFNYANCILRIIFKDVLKLQYRINYLHQNYYKDIHTDDQSNCADVFFHRILERTLGSYIVKSDPYQYFICDTYSPFKELHAYRKYAKMFHEINDDIYNYIFNKIAKKASISWLSAMPPVLDDIDLKSLEKSVNEMQGLSSISFKIIKNLLGNSHDKSSNMLLILESTIAKAMLEIIKRKVFDFCSLDLSLNEIKDALGHALITPFIDPQKPDQVTYIKTQSRYMQHINTILKAFDLSPLQNFQNRTDLLRSLKLRYCSDSVILSPKVIGTYLYKDALA